jgi:hypothetical protein
MVAARKLKSGLVQLNPVPNPESRKSVHLPLYRRWTNGLAGLNGQRKTTQHTNCAIEKKIAVMTAGTNNTRSRSTTTATVETLTAEAVS